MSRRQDRPGQPDLLLSNANRLRNIVGHLITFIAVADTRNFHLAATELGKSQPVVSAQIKELEEILGAALFVRTTRSVHLTPAGRLLLKRAQPIVDETRALVRDFRNQAALGSGHLRISVSPTVAIGWMPAAIGALASEHPQITVSIREDMAVEMFEAVVSGDVSFGVGPFPAVPPGLAFTRLTAQRFCLVVPRDDPLAGSGAVPIESIPGDSVLCAGVGTSARTLVEAAFSRLGRALHPRYEAQHVQAVLGMVHAGLGVAIIPFVGERLIAAQGLCCRVIDAPGLARDIGLVEARGIARSAAAAAFVRAFPADPE